MKRNLLLLVLAGLLGRSVLAQSIRVSPVGVNVNSNGATTVFLTFGGVNEFRAAEATWCGELIAATPDFGRKCDPATIFGSLPSRFDLSAASGIGALTDIMSIPPSVSRRAFQAAQQGADSVFFYVRRFVNLRGGPDEYVVVTCRMTEGGARSTFSLTEVKLSFAAETPILFLKPSEKMPPIKAEISYNGTGRLKGRWEVVLPGDEPPDAEDLLTEATLPIEQRGSQRRYTQLNRFNVFLPPSGRYVLNGPESSRLPTRVDGPYLVLLRIEVSDDREGDSDLAAAGAGFGIVHSGAVAGFPLPVLRYYVGRGESLPTSGSSITLLEPEDHALVAAEQKVTFVWAAADQPSFYRLEIEDDQGTALLAALLPQTLSMYRAPSWLREKAPAGKIRWRVAGMDATGSQVAASPWRELVLAKNP